MSNDRQLFPQVDQDELAAVNAKIAATANEIALDEALIESLTYEPKKRIKENKAALGTYVSARRFLLGDVEPAPSTTPAPDPGERVRVVGGAMNGDKLAKAAAQAAVDKQRRAAGDTE